MTPAEFEELTGRSLSGTGYDCHRAAHSLVHALGRGRVARGTCRGIGGQHSWMVDGEDCYAERARIIDPTLWSYQGVEPYVWEGTARMQPLHVPHGHGNIWRHGQPPEPTEDVIELAEDPGDEATKFLKFAAPYGLDRRGWAVLLHSPVGGWPAAEIVAAAYRTPALAAIPPIDIVGMLTDINPGGAYR